MKRKIFLFLFTIIGFFSFCFSKPLHDIWKIQPDQSIIWNISPNESHFDHIEMSGKRISVVLRYGVNKEGAFLLNKSLVFPLLRTIPNNTFGSLRRRLNWNALDLLTVNGYSLTNESVKNITLKGIMKVESDFRANWDKVHVSRTYFPSVDKPVLIELYNITNNSNKDLAIEVPSFKSVIETDSKDGVKGKIYSIMTSLDKSGTFHLKEGQSLQLTAINTAYIKGTCQIQVDSNEELIRRVRCVDHWMNHLVFESPDTIINTMFAFSKIRACESIYETKSGPMHGPGGEAYYAAIWANDQAEYINPYFPFTGYDYGNSSAFNAYKLFSKYMNKEWNPIPSSIIAEGSDIWCGAGDRGDAAMIAYGASRYALARGNKKEAAELWPLIQWCLEYCKRKINSEGVVESKTDELEGRLPAGKANLNTSSLYYDALISASYLNKELGGKMSLSKEYKKRAQRMRENIETYFGRRIDGFDTYSYYKGNKVLRSWICTPLVMGINERAKGTVQGLFSPRLWTENGLLSQEGNNTYWDRSTLYALRGTFYVGETDKAFNYFKYYSEQRLLGDHVPYAIEAWPEGEQRHLSAESGLYGRIITEGIFGIRPIGFRKFIMMPHLPSSWSKMALRKIGAFESDFDIEVVRRKTNNLEIIIKSDNNKINIKRIIKNGDSMVIRL
jgi:hypothetical protein